MVVFDIGIILITAIFGIKGFLRGTVKELIGLGILFIALFVAPLFADNAGNFIVMYFHLNISQDNFYFLGFLVIVVTSIIIGWLLSMILMLFLHITGLTILNRIIGLVVGGLKSIIILSLIIIVLKHIDLSNEYLKIHTKNSIFYEKLINYGNFFMKNIKIAKDKIQKHKKEINNTTSTITTNILKNKNVKLIQSKISNELDNFDKNESRSNL